MAARVPRPRNKARLICRPDRPWTDLKPAGLAGAALRTPEPVFVPAEAEVLVEEVLVVLVVEAEVVLLEGTITVGTPVVIGVNGVCDVGTPGFGVSVGRTIVYEAAV